LRNHKKGLVASSNSFSIWINFSLLNHPNGESFPPFCAKQSPSHTRPFALCPGVVCVYWKRKKGSVFQRVRAYRHIRNDIFSKKE
jgi:hypothetical protein